MREDAKENAQPMETEGPVAGATGAAPAVTPAPVAKPAAAMGRGAVPQHLFQTPGPTPSPSEE